MSILADIYNNQYRAQAHGPQIPRELREQDIAFWERATEALGRGYADRQLHRSCTEQNLSDIHNFREGFRFALLLMLEIL